MKSAVKVTANPTTGEVFTLNQNPGKDGKNYGYIRVEQTSIDLSQRMGNVRSHSALIGFSEERWNLAKPFLKEGTELPGNIVRTETTKTNDDGTPLLGYREKRAGNSEDAPVCKVGGKIIYQTSFYDEAGEQADTLVAHDNIAEIKAYQDSKKVQLNTAGN